jgi:dienelactone hydrolase
MRYFCPVLTLLSGVAALAQTTPVESALSKPLLAPNQPLIEAQVYTASHVQSMPLISTAAQWDQVSEQIRNQVLDRVVLQGEAKNWREAKTRVEWLETLNGPGYRVKKLRYEAIPGLWIPALLYEPEKLSGKVAAVLNVNGHEGTGMSTPYIQLRCINLAKRGILALNFEWYGMGQLKLENFDHYRSNQIDLTGTSGVALHYLAQKRAIDLLLAHPNADPDRLAVTGLSGGGWQTIFISALDKRVKLANPVAGYSSFVTRSQFPDMDLGDSEQTPVDLAGIADYTTLTAMLAPRRTLITNNALDTCCFRGDYANSPLIWAARPIFALYNAADRLTYHINFDAGHNYGQDNREAFYRVLRDTFYPGDKDFRVTEIPSEDEVRTADQLRVELPSENLDFHSIAVKLSRELPRQTGRSLADVVRAKTYAVAATEVGSEDVDGFTIKRWQFRMDNDWTVPAVDISRGASSPPVILIGDKGRAALAAEAQRLLSAGKRVIAVDPFYFGESKISKRDFLFALLISSVGDRPLGIQASQIAAIARWVKTPVSIQAFGPRSSLIASVAAALEGRAITGVETHDALSSLKQVIEKNMKVDEAPELFCFGLLESFDIPQISKTPKPVALKSYEIYRATSPITIDGKLDERDWQRAPGVGDFGFPWPKEGEKEQTVAKILWDDTNLYVSWYAHDKHISASVTQRHGPVSKDDCVEIFLSPNPDEVKNYYTFEINAIGTMLNRARTDWWTGPPNWEPEGVQYRTSFHGLPKKEESPEDSYWIVEAAIPLKNFMHDAANTPPHDGDRWRLNLQRLGGITNAQSSTWSPLPEGVRSFHTPEAFGWVRFVKSPPPASSPSSQ